MTAAAVTGAGTALPAAGQAVVPAGERGRLRFRNRVITRLAAHLATEVDEVSGVPGRRGDGDAKCAAVVDGGVTNVRLDVSVAYPHSVLAATRAVRAHVRDRLGALTGLAVNDVRIEVVRLNRERVR